MKYSYRGESFDNVDDMIVLEALCTISDTPNTAKFCEMCRDEVEQKGKENKEKIINAMSIVNAMFVSGKYPSDIDPLKFASTVQEGMRLQEYENRLLRVTIQSLCEQYENLKKKESPKED